MGMLVNLRDWVDARRLERDTAEPWLQRRDQAYPSGSTYDHYGAFVLLEGVPLVSRAGPVIRGAEGIEVRAANYREGRLDLDLTANNLQVLDQLKRNLLQVGSDIRIVEILVHGALVAALALAGCAGDEETVSELNRTLGQTRETLAGVERLLVPNSPLQAEAASTTTLPFREYSLRSSLFI